jgi:hypothetical protein
VASEILEESLSSKLPSLQCTIPVTGLEVCYYFQVNFVPVSVSESDVYYSLRYQSLDPLATVVTFDVDASSFSFKSNHTVHRRLGSRI